MRALSPPPGQPPQPRPAPGHVVFGVSGYGTLPPHQAPSWEGGAWAHGGGLPPLPSGCWPFKAAAARACPRVTRGEGVVRNKEPIQLLPPGSPQAHRQPGVGGGEAGSSPAKAGRPGVGSAGTGTGRETGPRGRGGRGHGWSRLPLRCGARPPHRLQPPKVLLDPAEPGIAHQHPLGPK